MPRRGEGGEPLPRTSCVDFAEEGNEKGNSRSGAEEMTKEELLDALFPPEVRRDARDPRSWAGAVAAAVAAWAGLAALALLGAA